MKTSTVALVKFGMYTVLFTILLLYCVRGESESNIATGAGSNFRVDSKMRVTAQALTLWDRGFIENRGQIIDSEGQRRDDIAFTATVEGAEVYFMPTGISYVFATPKLPKVDSEAYGCSTRKNPDKRSTWIQCRVDLVFDNANPDVHIEGIGASVSRSNYFLAHCPMGILDVPSYGTIVYRGIYPNIDYTLTLSRGRLKSEYRIHPGGDPSSISMHYEGHTASFVGEDGVLHVFADQFRIEETRPYSYYSDGPAVESAWRMTEGTLRLSVEHHREDRTLVIDPWASFYGGTSGDRGTALDVSGNSVMYLAGETHSSNFPIVNGVQTIHAGGGPDAFIMKLSSSGTPQWSTFYGGSGEERVLSLDLRGSNLVVGGCTGSTNFPLHAPYQAVYGGGQTDAFLIKLSTMGGVSFATYMGGSDTERGSAHACLDATGNMYLAGRTSSTDFPVLNAMKDTLSGPRDGFIAKFNSTGALQWSTYFGGSGDERLASAVYGTQLVISGATESADFPVLNPLQNALNGNEDAFIAALSAQGTLMWSTYYGGSGGELAFDVDVNSQGDVVAAGRTSSTDFPVVAAAQSSYAGNGDAMVMLLHRQSSTSMSMGWATYLGGQTSGEAARGITFDASGSVIVTGITKSTDFPISFGAYQSSHGGNDDCFITKYNAQGRYSWSTYYGAQNSDTPYAGVCTDASNGIYFAGETGSPNFPVVNPWSTSQGSWDAFVVALDPGGWIPVELSSFDAHGSGTTVILEWRTETETNNMAFVLERSTPSVPAWREIACIPGSGNSTAPRRYSYIDELPAIVHGDILTYRLSQIDFDGTRSVLSTIKVSHAARLAAAERVQVFPQPADDQAVLTITDRTPGDAFVIEIFDTAGRLVYETRLAGNLSQHNVRIPTDAMPSGVYLFTIKGRQQLRAGRLIVAHQ